MTTTSIIDPAIVRFSVRARPNGDRGGAVREFYNLPATGRAFLRHGFEPSPDRPLYIDGAMRTLPGLGLVSLACSQARTERARQDVNDDDLWLNITLAGRRAVWHCGRETEFGDGEALLSTGSSCSRNAFSDTRFVSFRVPFKPIAALVPDVEDRICRPIRRDVEALRLLALYSDFLMRGAPAHRAPDMQRLAVSHAHDLLALTLGATRDAAESARSRGLRAARLESILAEIEANFARPEFSPRHVALKLGLSPRYVQELLQESGSSFTERVLELRLQQARAMLADTRHNGRTVSDITLGVGFTDISYFNRRFRGRFGAAPNSFRTQPGSVN